MHRLAWASFFGDTHRELKTDSFDFSEMIAEVPDREVPEHTHENAHFVFVVRGTYVTEARNRPGECGARTLIFNPGGTTHRDRFRSDRGRFFTISVNSDVARQIETRHPAAIQLAKSEAADVAQQVHREFQTPTEFSDLILEGLGLEIAGRTAQWLAHPDRSAPRWLASARDSIHDRCTTRVSIRHLAAEAQVHPIHLARAFRQYFGCSPGEYLRRCRIERVCELLAASELPLADVALEAGFSDQSQLTHAFRKATGVTPRAFRRRNHVSR